MVQTYFDNRVIGDLNQSLNKEYLITSNKGLYATSSLCNCNRRKYHGLLITRQPNINDEDHLLISSIDETITIGNRQFALANHTYPGKLEPEGHRYIKCFYGSPCPKWIYRLNDTIISKEILLSDANEGIMIRYTLEEGPNHVELKLVPLLAFRNVHTLCRVNSDVDTKVAPIANGIKLRLYQDYTDLYIQFSYAADFIHEPDWHYNIEYTFESLRGYDYHEDLYTPGQFRLQLKKGEQVVVFAGLKDTTPAVLKSHFSRTLQKTPVLNTMEDCLDNARKQFFIRKKDRTEIKAGYPWFGSWARDTFIALPGLTLIQGDIKTFKAVIKTLLYHYKNGLFPNVVSTKNAAYNSVDAPLWFIWSIQQYSIYTGSKKNIWKEYGKYLRSILENYGKGTLHNIKMDNDCLISAGETGFALTWMDSIVNGEAVTPRSGKPVEINALWYNAVCFCLEIASLSADYEFINKWRGIPENIKDSFIARFIDAEKEYLADYNAGCYTDWSIRPNQIFALSLPYSPVPEHLRRNILNTIKEELLTPRGLRTLAVKDPAYIGVYSGNQESRDAAYHQGTVWPWLTGHFAEAYLNVYGNEGVPFIEQLYKGFEPALEEYCLYTIPEIYNGNHPHTPVGAVSQAWSVAELLRINRLIQTYKTQALVNMETNTDNYKLKIKIK